MPDLNRMSPSSLSSGSSHNASLVDILDRVLDKGLVVAGDIKISLAEIERQAILQTLERTNGNKRAAASILGVYRPTLYGKLRKYKLGEYGAAAAPKVKKTRVTETASGEAGDSEPRGAERRPRTPHGVPRP